MVVYAAVVEQSVMRITIGKAVCADAVVRGKTKMTYATTGTAASAKNAA
jgi:hypothetical protein